MGAQTNAMSGRRTVLYILCQTQYSNLQRKRKTGRGAGTAYGKKKSKKPKLVKSVERTLAKVLPQLLEHRLKKNYGKVVASDPITTTRTVNGYPRNH